MHKNKLNFLFLVLAVFLFSSICFAQTDKKTGNGIGSGTGTTGNNTPQRINQNSEGTAKLKVLSKPKSNYTDIARKNGIEGVVRLRVTFLASGEIGTVTPIVALPYGLTEQAIEAARKLKYQPALKDGVPYPVIAAVEYYFYLYYSEDDKDLERNAEILDIPNPALPEIADADKFGGTVKLTLMLKSDGGISVNRIESNLPKEFQEEAVKAVSKIKFNPAVHKNGNKVSQRKEIEYEFKPQKD